MIRGQQSGKVLDASLSNPGEVIIWTYLGENNQFWYWDGEDVLRNKLFTDWVKRSNVSVYKR